MRRTVAFLVCGLALAVGATASADAHPLPTLGVTFSSPAEGFGEIEPGDISLGGDPTGVVLSVRWRRWGRPRAIGRGRGWFLPPSAKYVSDGHWAKARVLAWDLGSCHGQWAYGRVEWYFPEYHRHGHFPPATYLDPKYAVRACDGD